MLSLDLAVRLAKDKSGASREKHRFGLQIKGTVAEYLATSLPKSFDDVI
jgi:hypothetical protein